jgi:hypothetical protein
VSMGYSAAPAPAAVAAGWATAYAARDEEDDLQDMLRLLGV